ncbi:zinc finger, CCHC-type containing protein [Tanacetum coccineum]
MKEYQRLANYVKYQRLADRHQRAMKESLSAKPQRATSDVFKSKTSRVRGGNTLMILLPFEEEQVELVILSKYGLGEIIQQSIMAGQSVLEVKPVPKSTRGTENPIRTLGDYSKPSQEGYRNTIELPVGNNMVPLRSDTSRLAQNGCSFHRLQSEDPNQHLKDFLKLVDSRNLDSANKEITRLHLFQFSLRDQASNWIERLSTGSITIWEDLTTRFLAQFFPPRRIVKLRNDILLFQQHHGESLSEAWTHFKDLLQKVPQLVLNYGFKFKSSTIMLTTPLQLGLIQRQA